MTDIKLNEKKPGRPRRNAPRRVTTNRTVVSEREEIVRQFAPECIDEQETFAVARGAKVVESAIGIFKNDFKSFFGDPAKPKGYYEARGYEAIVNDGEPVTHRGDPLYRIPTDKWVARRVESEADSESFVNQALEGDEEASALGLRRDIAD